MSSLIVGLLAGIGLRRRQRTRQRLLRLSIALSALFLLSYSAFAQPMLDAAPSAHHARASLPAPADAPLAESEAASTDLGLPNVGTAYSVGVVLSLSGPQAELGAARRDAILNRIDQVNVEQRGLLGPDGALHPVVVYVEDDGGDPLLAADLARRLIADQRVVALIGSAALAPAADQEQVPTIALEPTAPPQTDWMFAATGADVAALATGWLLDAMQVAGTDRPLVRLALTRLVP